MTYENFKNGVFRICFLVMIGFWLLVIGENLSMYTLLPSGFDGLRGFGVLFLTTLGFWTIYFLSFWIIDGFVGKK